MNTFIKFKSSSLFLFVFLFVFAVCYLNAKELIASSYNGSKTFLFTKNLKIGDINEDVRTLQQVLNNNPDTEVSSYGAGSRGNETPIFGALTENAVVKFQELYADDILNPLGLKKGTGFVGIATRLKLNSLIEESKLENRSSSEKKNFSSSSSSELENQSYSSSQSVSQNANFQNGNSSSPSAGSSSQAAFFKSAFEVPGVRIYSTSEYQIKPGDTISIIGEGFTPTANIVHIGESRAISNLKTDNSSSLSFTVPNDLPASKYGIWVENENGTSKNKVIKIYIVITNNPAERPVVESVEPKETTYDSEIIVSGKGFTASGNNIHSIFGSIMNISSPDGKTLRFKPSSMAQIAKLQSEKSAKNMQMEVSFYIVNDNGYNKEPASFVIRF